jgi:signal transduction histidine kinase
MKASKGESMPQRVLPEVTPSMFNEQDKYELLHYFVSKLETRTTISEIYSFLLEFMMGISGGYRESAPACIFLANPQTLEFELIASAPANTSADVFNQELVKQIDNGIVAWCITNRHPAFLPVTHAGIDMNCLLVPLSTIEQTLGLALLYMNIEEAQLSHQSLQVISLACTQTALYADNKAMFTKLQGAQSRLVHSEKLSAIGQLAAGVAHEINNPVGFVLGNSEVLIDYIKALKEMILAYEKKMPEVEIIGKKTELDIEYILTDIDKLMNENLDGLRRVTEIVTNLKDFAHVDQRDVFVVTDLEENLLKTLTIANNEIRYHATVQTSFGNISPVLCNAGGINQVFLNIFINAAQAITDQKRKDLGLIKVLTRQDEISVYIEIADDGPGIPEEILPKIFDPFFSTKPVGKGTGLGLNIAYDIIVNKHHGDISVKSDFGKGTCFTIRLPRESKKCESLFTTKTSGAEKV